MILLPTLKAGDSVDIIAPAARCSAEQLTALLTLLDSWQLKCIIADDIFGTDPFCANTDQARSSQLIDALTNTKSKAVICARGGYGSMRLLPQLSKITPPKQMKLFVGMSDITALHLFLQQQWHWPTIHGALAPDRFSPESIAALKVLLMGDTKEVNYTGLIPLNSAAKTNRLIEGSMIGGNLSLVQTSIGTSWQLNGRDKIIFLEDRGERGYRLDRMFQHLIQANIFKDATAILLGDFIEGNEPNGQSFIEIAIQRFAESISIPIVQIKGIGHGDTNFPLPLGTFTTLKLGNEIQLTSSLNTSSNTKVTS